MTRALAPFLAANDAVVLVRVTEALGSTPREKGAWMLVAHQAIFGTIGGGQLEFMAIARARDMLEAGAAHATMDVPLGPEIGQCCGGRVAIALDTLDEDGRNAILTRMEMEDAARPHVYLFGGGHVGHALAEALALLPVAVHLVETRAEALDGLPGGIHAMLTAMPETVVADARPNSAFIVLTHDHALDFLIVAAALARSDAAYVGMIGSKTKRATFRSWYQREAGGTAEDEARLICPIGGSIADKRPAVIAALVAAELLRAFSPVD
jgi:xanthine dehydrogenase accessory factor